MGLIAGWLEKCGSFERNSNGIDLRSNPEDFWGAGVPGGVGGQKK